MNALPRGSRGYSYHKPRFQSPRSAARAEASAKKAPRIVPAILPESVGASHFRLIWVRPDRHSRSWPSFIAFLSPCSGFSFLPSPWLLLVFLLLGYYWAEVLAPGDQPRRHGGGGLRTDGSEKDKVGSRAHGSGSSAPTDICARHGSSGTEIQSATCSSISARVTRSTNTSCLRAI